MNEDNTSPSTNEGEKTTVNKSEIKTSSNTNTKKKFSLFGKKSVKANKQTSQHGSTVHGAEIHHVAPKQKNDLKKGLNSVAKWVKKNSLITTVVLLLVILTIGAIAWYLNTRPQPRTLNTNNQVITEYKSKLPELQKAVSADNNSAAAHKNYAVALYVTGNYEAAKNEYEAAVKLDGKDSTTYNNLGNTYRDLGKYDKAKTAYEKAFEISPTSINPYVNLANIQLYTLNDNNAAIATYQKALKAMPNNNQISLLLGIAYEKAGKTTEAKQTYQDILTRNAEDKAAKAGLDRLNK
ncbi:hypothetical protein CVV43_05535 [Candidatus Saccharibacteria bacterium HGW-Saccharibacteria-1]|jgi:tetratricopeptide (TPR) repeat protein|nr:MAG: hypothetical protein CVV43_05535 [Candidatus Saccharibacteria bacterium HGW-Saccharibacteria-1]